MPGLTAEAIIHAPNTNHVTISQKAIAGNTVDSAPIPNRAADVATVGRQIDPCVCAAINAADPGRPRRGNRGGETLANRASPARS